MTCVWLPAFEWYRALFLSLCSKAHGCPWVTMEKSVLEEKASPTPEEHKRQKYKIALRLAVSQQKKVSKTSTQSWDFPKSRPWSSQKPCCTEHNDDMKENQFSKEFNVLKHCCCPARYLRSECQLKNTPTRAGRAVPGQLEAPRKVKWWGPLFHERRRGLWGMLLVEPRSGETVQSHTNFPA